MTRTRRKQLHNASPLVPVIFAVPRNSTEALNRLLGSAPVCLWSSDGVEWTNAVRRWTTMKFVCPLALRLHVLPDHEGLRYNGSGGLSLT